MSGFHNNALIGASGQGGYQINQSLRFDGSAYLNRTPASAGNRKTWTWSGWVKRSSLANHALFSAGTADSTRTLLYFDASNGQLYFFNNASGTITGIFTSAYYRDVSAWYHVVLSVDTTQATASNRAKIYINGIEQTVSNYVGAISQNSDLYVNATNAHGIGAQAFGTAVYSNGYLAEVNFIDGTALTPSSFGETDTITGAWIPKKYSGSYGTNGFYLKYESSGIGTDSSGNGNTWTATGFSTSGTGTDVMSDTPTNNWCTLNPLVVIPRGTISNGNLNYLSGSTASHGSAAGSFTLPTTGKWYWEVTACANSGGSGNNEAIGIANIQNNPQLPASGSEIGSRSGDYAHRSSAARVSGGSSVSYGATYTNGDVIGVAWDSDAGTLVFYKNGSSQGTAYSSITQEAGKYAPASSNAESSNGDDFNFGQRAFAYTPPTGYKALNTANLPEPTIKKGSKYFDTVLYTGNGTARSITGLGFSPDFVWIKERNNAVNHLIFDNVRGSLLSLTSNNTAAEVNYASSLTSFDTTGFSLGTASGINDSSDTYVAWCWDANGAGSSNTAGSITSTVSANASAGFSIVRFVNPSSGGIGTVGHGLGVAPAFVIAKNRTGVDNWPCAHPNIAANEIVELNSSGAKSINNIFGSVRPGATTFSFAQVGGDWIAYCFSEVAGYSKFGSYTGNGSTDGVFIYCGFRPRWIMVKTSSNAYGWAIFDTARQTYNEDETLLQPNTSSAEATNSAWGVDILSNGFKWRNGGEVFNFSGYTYIFAAFAELPAKYSNAR